MGVRQHAPLSRPSPSADTLSTTFRAPPARRTPTDASGQARGSRPGNELFVPGLKRIKGHLGITLQPQEHLRTPAEHDEEQGNGCLVGFGSTVPGNENAFGKDAWNKYRTPWPVDTGVATSRDVPPKSRTRKSGRRKPQQAVDASCSPSSHCSALGHDDAGTYDVRTSIQGLWEGESESEWGKVEGGRGSGACADHTAQVNYLGERQSCSYTQFVGTYFGKLLDIASNGLKVGVGDVVIAVPGWYTDIQTRAVLDAAAIANLNVLRLINDTTDIALGCGITNTNLPEREAPGNVAFVNVSHATPSVSIVAFSKGQLTIPSTVYDQDLGRDETTMPPSSTLPRSSPPSTRSTSTLSSSSWFHPRSRYQAEDPGGLRFSLTLTRSGLSSMEPPSPALPHLPTLSSGDSVCIKVRTRFHLLGIMTFESGYVEELRRRRSLPPRTSTLLLPLPIRSSLRPGNTVEEYVHDMRGKVEDRHAVLKEIGDKVVFRYHEVDEDTKAATQLRKTFNSYMAYFLSRRVILGVSVPHVRSTRAFKVRARFDPPCLSSLPSSSLPGTMSSQSQKARASQVAMSKASQSQSKSQSGKKSPPSSSKPPKRKAPEANRGEPKRKKHNSRIIESESETEDEDEDEELEEENEDAVEDSDEESDDDGPMPTLGDWLAVPANTKSKGPYKPYHKAAQWIMRAYYPFTNYHNLWMIFRWCKRKVFCNLETQRRMSEEEFRKKYCVELGVIAMLRDLIVDFDEDLSTVRKEQFPRLAQLMTKASYEARGTDLKDMKNSSVNYSAVAFEKWYAKHDWVKPLDPTKRKDVGRGPRHPLTLYLLLPPHMTENVRDPDNWKKEWQRLADDVLADKIILTGRELPRMLYGDLEYDPQDLQYGLLLNTLLITCWKHIFLAPTSATRKDGGKRSTPKNSKAGKNEMTEVTAASIAYTAMLLFWSFSDLTNWKYPEHFDAEVYWNTIMSLFYGEAGSGEDVDEEWVKTTMDAWNAACFAYVDEEADYPEPVVPSTWDLIKEQRRAAQAKKAEKSSASETEQSSSSSTARTTPDPQASSEDETSKDLEALVGKTVSSGQRKLQCINHCLFTDEAYLAMQIARCHGHDAGPWRFCATMGFLQVAQVHEAEVRGHELTMRTPQDHVPRDRAHVYHCRKVVAMGSHEGVNSPCISTMDTHGLGARFLLMKEVLKLSIRTPGEHDWVLLRFSLSVSSWDAVERVFGLIIHRCPISDRHETEDHAISAMLSSLSTYGGWWTSRVKAYVTISSPAETSIFASSFPRAFGMAKPKICNRKPNVKKYENVHRIQRGKQRSVLRRVSKQWKKAVLDNPKFWSHISLVLHEIKRKHELKAVKQYIRRSKGAKRTLCIVDPGFVDYDTEMAETRYGLMEFILETKGWDTAYIELEGHTEFAAEIYDCRAFGSGTEETWRSLRKLTVKSNEEAELVFLTNDFSCPTIYMPADRYPALRYVTLSISGSSVSSWILPWSQLNRLKLEYFVDGLEAHLKILNECTAFEEYDLTISSEYERNNSKAFRKSLPPSIVSHSLRIFHIQIQTIDCPELTSAFFDKLRFPALELFKVSQAIAGAGERASTVNFRKTWELREFQQDFSAIYRAPYHCVHQNRKVNPPAPPVDPRIGHLRDDGWKVRVLVGDEAYDARTYPPGIVSTPVHQSSPAQPCIDSPPRTPTSSTDYRIPPPPPAPIPQLPSNFRVAAHGAVTGYRINGEVYPGYDAYAPPEGQSTIARPFRSSSFPCTRLGSHHLTLSLGTLVGIDPLFDVLNETIGCNSDGNPIGKEGKQLTATIRAGDTITAIYGLWIHPFGPATVYLARCPGSCSEVNSKELEWFKIDHAGLLDGNIVYAPLPPYLPPTIHPTPRHTY
ncbi:hypothetical protein NMY22_g8354 [Coprinellus aureogranulatus]|nr:hypothetical protein NMY22_g8354 [Coprinellus aureogranulatus]